MRTYTYASNGKQVIIKISGHGAGFQGAIYINGTFIRNIRNADRDGVLTMIEREYPVDAQATT